jgi:hypothetical protein
MRSKFDRKVSESRVVNTMIRNARSVAIESSIAFDSLLNAAIAEYFVENQEKREFLEMEVLPILPISQRIKVLESLPLGPSGQSIGKQYPRLIRRLNLLNSYRNLLVHGYPSTWGMSRIWIHRGKMKPFPINKRLVNKMERLSETTFESLSRLFERLMKWGRSTAETEPP